MDFSGSEETNDLACVAAAPAPGPAPVPAAAAPVPAATAPAKLLKVKLGGKNYAAKLKKKIAKIKKF